jgi:hypothetical protein
MSNTLPTGSAMLAAASWSTLCELRNHLIDNLGADNVSSLLLPAVLAEIDRRPEGQARARRRQFAVLEGEEQVRRRRDNCRWRLVDHARHDNRPMWSSPLNLPAAEAWLAFRGLAARPLYRAATGSRQLTLHTWKA